MMNDRGRSFWERCWACRVMAGETFGCVVDESPDVLALLNPFPLNPGHALVAPRRRGRDLYELPDGLAGPILSTAARLAFGADGVTLRQNNGAASDQHLFHFHLHVIARFGGDFGRFGAAARLRASLADEGGHASGW